MKGSWAGYNGDRAQWAQDTVPGLCFTRSGTSAGKRQKGLRLVSGPWAGMTWRLASL